jgi:hypothetical protein
MSGLAEWLASGAVPAIYAAETKMPSRSRRQKGIRRGGKVMFLGGALFPLFLGLSIAVDEPGPLIFPVLIFFVGLAMMLYSRLFVEDIPSIQSQQAQTTRFGAMSGASALPPPSNIPIPGPGNFAGQQVRTNELAQPASVTEHTTKLLDQE